MIEPEPDVVSAFQKALSGCASFDEMAAVVNKILHLDAERMIEKEFPEDD